MTYCSHRCNCIIHTTGRMCVICLYWNSNSTLICIIQQLCACRKTKKMLVSHLWGCLRQWLRPAPPASAERCKWCQPWRGPPRQWTWGTGTPSSPPEPERPSSGPREEKQQTGNSKNIETCFHRTKNLNNISLKQVWVICIDYSVNPLLVQWCLYWLLGHKINKSASWYWN